jgi:DNA polymerase-3 subunit delta'
MPERLIGNEQVKEFLRRMIAAGRLPGAMLFAGPDGVGKKRFALEIARSVFCAETLNFGSCGKCGTCKRVLQFVLPRSEKRDDYDKVIFSEHADVGLVIPFGRNIGVGAIRELEREANFRPYEGKKRFFVIDEADKMNLSAANALLKTLEEPPVTTHIILLTSRYNSLLATIVSRCQMLRFQPLAAEEIENHLAATKQFSPEDAGVAARISRGSLGRALQMNGESFRSSREAMMKILEAQTAAPDRARLLRAAEEMGDTKMKDEYEPRLEILQSLIHDAWQLKNGREQKALVNADLHGRLSKCAENSTAEKLTRLLAEIEKVRENLLVNINRRVATDALFMSAAG